MSEEENKQKIELSKYRKHQKKFPWSLVRKIIIAIVMIALFYYLFETLKSKENNEESSLQDGIPIEVSN